VPQNYLAIPRKPKIRLDSIGARLIRAPERAKRVFCGTNSSAAVSNDEGPGASERPVSATTVSAGGR
jgi:hypothetical protein